jgi:hypothetical protein
MGVGLKGARGPRVKLVIVDASNASIARELIRATNHFATR